MAFLINRNVSGRLPCLHGISKYIVAQFGDADFTINDLKYDEEKKYNIHDFSPCSIKLGSSNITTCRYLENPFSPSKCALVQSVTYDPQKSKLASDIMNALDGLGIVKRSGRYANITQLGKDFASSELYTENWLDLARQCVLSYGPFVGMIYSAILKSDERGRFNRASIDELGYPRTEEVVSYKGHSVILSTGSQNDTITRTKSVLLSWGLSSGLIESPEIVDVNDYVMSTSWNVRNYQINKSLFEDTKLYVKNPLSYPNLTKNTSSLRERGQSDVRELTVRLEPIVKNRRLAIIAALNYSSERKKKINYTKLCREIEKYPEQFVVEKEQFLSVMASELKVAFIVGLPYKFNSELIEPLTNINMEPLLYGIDEKVDMKIREILKASENYEE